MRPILPAPGGHVRLAAQRTCEVPRDKEPKALRIAGLSGSQRRACHLSAQTSSLGVPLNSERPMSLSTVCPMVSELLW
jgi:hypothetical protein